MDLQYSKTPIFNYFYHYEITIVTAHALVYIYICKQN